MKFSNGIPIEPTSRIKQKNTAHLRFARCSSLLQTNEGELLLILLFRLVFSSRT